MYIGGFMKNFFLLSIYFLFAGCGWPGHKPDAVEYLARGEMYHKTGKLKKALSNLNKAEEADAYNAEVYAARGALLFDFGEYEKALSDFNAVINLTPYRSEAYAAAGASLAALGRFVLARENILKALELNPVNVQALSSLGGIYFSTGNFKASAEEYTKAINLQPAAAFYFMRGAAYEKLGSLEAARADYQSAGLTPAEYPKLD
jgi:tetratricopeptide (TPR) repeat protein